MKINDFVKKIQNLSLTQRKIILLVIVIIVGLALGSLWIKITKERLKNFNAEELIGKLELPSFEQEFEGIEFGTGETIEQIEKLRKYLEEHPEKMEELMENPGMLEGLMKEIEEQNPEATNN